MEKIQTPWYNDGLLFFARTSGWIGGPVIIAVFLGKWLDTRYGTRPWLFLLCTGIAFVFSFYGLIKETKKYMTMVSDKELAKKNSISQK
jgi:F0F1-type ATP synthase assembly protein I